MPLTLDDTEEKTIDQTPHPAKFSDALLPEIARMVKGCKCLLDNQAGVGKIIKIRDHGFKGQIYCNDLEREWVQQVEGKCEGVTVCDARNLSCYPSGFFDAIATSHTYANRMADHHDAKDGSRRMTYKHCLGRDLRPGNTGMMQWGDEYRYTNTLILFEALRLLCKGGIYVHNLKDHIRKGRIVEVTAWYVMTMERLGFKMIEWKKITLPGMRYGENREVRIDHESLIKFRKVRA